MYYQLYQKRKSIYNIFKIYNNIEINSTYLNSIAIELRLFQERNNKHVWRTHAYSVHVDELSA